TDALRVYVLDPAGDGREDPVGEVAHLLRVEPARHRAERDEVDEDHADAAALAPRELARQRAPAHTAVAEALWVVVAAGRAGQCVTSRGGGRGRSRRRRRP